LLADSAKVPLAKYNDMVKTFAARRFPAAVVCGGTS
jgi:hypothetical protein